MAEKPRFGPGLWAIVSACATGIVGTALGVKTVLATVLSAVVGLIFFIAFVLFEKRRHEREKWLEDGACKGCGELRGAFALYRSERAGGYVCVNCYQKAEGRLPSDFAERTKDTRFARLRREFEKRHPPDGGR